MLTSPCGQAKSSHFWSAACSHSLRESEFRVNLHQPSPSCCFRFHAHALHPHFIHASEPRLWACGIEWSGAVPVRTYNESRHARHAQLLCARLRSTVRTARLYSASHASRLTCQDPCGSRLAWVRSARNAPIKLGGPAESESGPRNAPMTRLSSRRADRSSDPDLRVTRTRDVLPVTRHD